ncbi:MAG: hypothetical protein IJ774_00540 [Selenomonadaceae bacterium]|nr:hypothetical protein [Selenomonadaceae bacterium]
MARLDLVLIFGLFAAFVLSICGFQSDDLTLGWCMLCVTILFAALNVINLLIDIRSELRRRRYGLGYG